jgi:uncharacterized membrane protein YphA (DoxX/SURF4 family)
MLATYEYDSQPMVRSVISVIFCVLIGLILLFAGTGKLAGLGQIPGQTEFLDKFIPDFLLTPAFAQFVGLVFIPWILPILEILIGLLLIIGIVPRLIAIIFLPLTLGFMANNSYMIASGVDKYPTCECFGIWEQNWFGGLTPMQSLYVDVGLFIMAIIIIFVHPLPFLANQFWIKRMSRNKL